ncbi:MAG TPA: hypothetical protein VNZ57_10225 [Longimicrobiales bacterium]|nr:hypothetical protein [Longimicrobiales bacterium]
MNLLFRAAAVAALLLPLAVAPATAQDYRYGLGIYGGGMWFSNFNRDADDIIIFDDGVELLVDADRLRLRDSWVAGAQAESWFGNGRFGARLNAAYSETDWRRRGDLLDDFFDFDLDFLDRDVNVWFGDLDLMVRILNPEPDRVWAPFVAVGAGFVHYNPAGRFLVDDVLFPFAAATFDGESQTEFAGVFGLGTDILPRMRGPVRLGFRVEAMDHVAFNSPLRRIEFDPFEDEFEIGDRFGAVHHVRLTAGIHLLGGRLFPPPVVVLPPAPPPAPPAPPAPPPPAEEALTICIIDANAPGWIREVSAVYVPAAGDTLTVVNGDRVAFRTAYPTNAPTYVRNADWFVAGQPLTMVVANQRYEYVTFGATRIIEPEDLAFLGTLQGVPVFAPRAEVASIMPALSQAHATSQDLPTIMAANTQLRNAIGQLNVVYVPYDIGCAFVPLQRIEEVLKVRG